MTILEPSKAPYRIFGLSGGILREFRLSGRKTIRPTGFFELAARGGKCAV